MTMSNRSAIGVFIGRPGSYLRTIGWTSAAGDINRGGNRTVPSAPHRKDENACLDQQDPDPVAHRRELAEEGEGERSNEHYAQLVDRLDDERADRRGEIGVDALHTRELSYGCFGRVAANISVHAPPTPRSAMALT